MLKGSSSKGQLLLRNSEVTLPAMREAEAAAQLAHQPRRRLEALVPRQRGPTLAALVTLRLQQWPKNLLVIAAAGAAGALGHDDVPGRVGVACFAFCLLSSGIYALNDVRDVYEDRLHPTKRFRPVAAGSSAAAPRSCWGSP